jgi:hypothetical protein
MGGHVKKFDLYAWPFMYHTIFIYHLLSVLVDVTMGGKFDYYKDVIHFLSKVTFSSVGTAVVFGVQGTGFEPCSGR